MRISSSWTFRLGLLTIIVLGAAFYLVLGRGAQDSVNEVVLRRQQTIARAEVSNITTFFERFGDGVATLAQTISVETRDENVLQDLDIFMEQRKDTGIIGGVILTDKSGIVRFNSNVLGTRDIGASIAERNFFIWAKNEAKEGEYYISRPIVSTIGATKDQTIVAVASPVFRNSTFTGVLSASVKLQPLVERFFGLMKLSDTTKTYVVGENGDIIYTNSDSQNGYQTFKDKLKDALSSNEEGQFATPKYLVAYSHLTLGVQKWLLITSSPAQEIRDLTTPFYIRQTILFIVTSAIILLFATIAGRKNQV